MTTNKYGYLSEGIFYQEDEERDDEDNDTKYASDNEDSTL